MTRKDDSPFAIAKRALQLIGEFGTPPTPEVYEVWYTYAAGSDEGLTRELDYAVKEARAVSEELMRSIHGQFCAKSNEAYGQVGDALATELQQIQSLVVRQGEAGSELAESMEAAGEALATKSENATVIAECISQIHSGTSKMKEKLEDVSVTLEKSKLKIVTLQTELNAAQRGMMTDHLTGLGNRRFFDSVIQQAIESADQIDDLVYLVLLDLDNFKETNDSRGHDVGDKLLQSIAQQLCSLRPDASLARFGGDEFAALLRVRNRDEVIEFSEKVQEHFRAAEDGPMTFSIGVARLRPTDNPAAWYKRADKLLYQAKNLGKNRAVVEMSIS